MTSSLASRLGDIPGVASVVVDLDGFGRGIDVRLEPDADELAVMESLRALLAAYGLRHERQPQMKFGRSSGAKSGHGVHVSLTPTDAGARIEVSTGIVKSFRLVSPDPLSVAQGLADAWCQVIGRIPIEIVSVEVDGDGGLSVVALDGELESTGSSDHQGDWVEALTEAVGVVLGDASQPDLKRAAS